MPEILLPMQHRRWFAASTMTLGNPVAVAIRGDAAGQHEQIAVR